MKSVTKKSLQWASLVGAALFNVAVAQANEGTVGNGGHVVECPREDGTMSYELLDRYEMRVLHGREVAVNEGDDWKSLAKTKLQSIARFAPGLSEETIRRVDRFESDTRFVEDFELTFIPDSQHLLIPRGCQVKQVAVNRIQQRLPEEKTYYIDKPIWDQLSTLDKAMLVVHEVLYTDSIRCQSRPTQEQGAAPQAVNSRGVRYLNSALFSGRIDQMSLEQWRTFGVSGAALCYLHETALFDGIFIRDDVSTPQRIQPQTIRFGAPHTLSIKTADPQVSVEIVNPATVLFKQEAQSSTLTFAETDTAYLRLQTPYGLGEATHRLTVSCQTSSRMSAADLLRSMAHTGNSTGENTLCTLNEAERSTGNRYDARRVVFAISSPDLPSSLSDNATVACDLEQGHFKCTAYPDRTHGQNYLMLSHFGSRIRVRKAYLNLDGQTIGVEIYPQSDRYERRFTRRSRNGHRVRFDSIRTGPLDRATLRGADGRTYRIKPGDSIRLDPETGLVLYTNRQWLEAWPPLE